MRDTQQATAAQPDSPATTELCVPKSSGFEHTLRREGSSLPYLLGAWASLTEVGTRPFGRICYASKDRSHIETLQDHLAAVISFTPDIHTVTIGGSLYYRIEPRHEQLATHIHSVTDNNNRIPWEHLGTESECAHFLRGVFDHGGHITADKNPAIGIRKVNGRELLIDMARVFVRLDLRPIIGEEPIANLRLRQKADWIRFAEVVGSSIEGQQQSLAKLCQLPETKRTFTIAEFQAVIACSQDPQKRPSDIARINSVPQNTVRDWLTRGQIPPAVKRDRAIQEMTKHLPNSDVITYVYKELGGSSALAREIAAQLSLHAAKERVQRIDPDISYVYGDDRRIRAALSAEPRL